MDDPTRRCENDTDNETHSRGPRSQAGASFFSKVPNTSKNKGLCQRFARDPQAPSSRQPSV
jgi:hypothetical protein